jgi:hypothetical protein
MKNKFNVIVKMVCCAIYLLFFNYFFVVVNSYIIIPTNVFMYHRSGLIFNVISANIMYLTITTTLKQLKSHLFI